LDLGIILSRFAVRVQGALVYLCLATVLSGCLGTRYLQENQKLLYKQKVKAPRGFSTEELEDVFVQKANRRLLGLPINTLVWMHHEGEVRYDQQKFIAKKDSTEKKFDRKIAVARTARKKANLQYRKQRKIDQLTSKIDNGNMPMQWGEPASVYDSQHVTLTVERINNYLFNRGYFRAQTFAKVSEYKKRVSVFYQVKPGRAFFYDSLAFNIPDSNVLRLVTGQKSFIRRNERFDQQKLEKERERIDYLLKDNGYYDFSRQYIHFDVDSTYGEPYQLAIRISIDNPPKREHHKQFVVDSVNFTTDAGAKAEFGRKRSTDRYNGITYSYYRNEYNKKILTQRVFVKKTSLYSRAQTFDTQRQLANLDVFKFVNINYDTSGGRFMANIFTSPLDRYSWSNEAGLTVTQGFPGPYVTTTLKKRNLFRGLEIFEVTGRFGFEGVAAATSEGEFYRSTEASVNATITIPQFLFPLSTQADYRYAKNNPRTRLLGGFTYTSRPEYTRSILTVSGSYSWDSKGKRQYTFTPVSLNIIRSKLSPEFDSLLTNLQATQGNNLRNSFDPSFVSAMIFSFTLNPNNYGNTERSSYFLRAQAEAGGTTFNFYTPRLVTSEGLALFKYIRLSVDFRRNRILNKNTILAYRVHTGVGYAYSDNRVLPYEKYFFVGGSNSVRAWRPRRLGIGTAPPPLSSNPEQNGLFNYQFERPGEIMVEGSVELRQKLFGFVQGAIFVDAGNVWSFRPVALTRNDASRANWTGTTQFEFDQFFKQLGVGTGFGLRFDFSFLVLRFDVGIKAYDPAREAGDRFVLNKFRFFRPFGTDREPVIYNIGIGYSF
jgi:outer membrane protein assembly factor BamA